MSRQSEDLYSDGLSSGVGIRAYPNGLYISGWYDRYVGIDGMFVPTEEIERLLKKAKRRLPYE